MSDRKIQFVLALCGMAIAVYAGCSSNETTGSTTLGGTPTSTSATSATTSASGSGGAGVGGGGSATSSGGGDTSLLGSPCTDDSECGSLTCIRSSDTNAVFGGGPAGGYCTTTCTADADCPGDGSACFIHTAGSPGVCVLTCTIGPPLMFVNDPLDPGKCLGRNDVSCSAIDASGTTACVPTCGEDAQCPTGRVCDPRSAVCVETPTTGKPEGAKCDANATTPECAGVCVSFNSSGGGGASACSSPCVLGGTGTSPTSSPECGGVEKGLCLYSPTDNGAGDFGFCAPSCSKQEDCQNPDFWCFSIGGLTGAGTKKGYCLGGTPCPNGASDCTQNSGKDTCTTTPSGPFCIDPAFPLGTAGAGGGGGAGGSGGAGGASTSASAGGAGGTSASTAGAGGTGGV